jgi:hypothetical protein
MKNYLLYHQQSPRVSLKPPGTTGPRRALTVCHLPARPGVSRFDLLDDGAKLTSTVAAEYINRATEAKSLDSRAEGGSYG